MLVVSTSLACHHVAVDIQNHHMSVDCQLSLKGRSAIAEQNQLNVH